MTDNPSQHELDTLASDLVTLAVTGTNGKTSTTSMLAEIARAAGELPVRVTSLGMWVGEEQTADDGSMAAFVRTLRRARQLGARTLALELTSRALEAGFAARWPAHVAIFTNLTHDHLDRHVTPERYLAAKAQLFVRLRPHGVAVLNAADPASALLAEVLPAQTRCVGFLAQPGRPGVNGVPIALAAERVSSDEHGSEIALAASTFCSRGEPRASTLGAALGGALTLRVLGPFQIDNALAAALAAASAGFAPEAIRRGLSAFAGVPGRFEACAREPLVLVDFAHSPDALERVLHGARALAARRGGRLGCVFGCGGERDPAKRPHMGALAARLADAVWLTTDNPRGESPDAIADMVRAGAAGGAAQWFEEPDRRAAIAAAIAWASACDVLVIAGRGAETQQQCGDAVVRLMDNEVVREALAKRGETQPRLVPNEGPA